jgi:hypothetical protein
MEVCLKLFFLHDTFEVHTLIGFQYSLADNYQYSKKMFLKVSKIIYW